MKYANRAHWENIYATKEPDQVSWTQAVPETSLHFIHELALPRTAGIIDIGGGDSRLAGCLIDEGFTDITVLDISSNALERARLRMADRADQVQWLLQDVTEFRPDRAYDVWHDRAAFHFLTTGELVSKYLEAVRRSGATFLVMGTFSDIGPHSCSGLGVRRYTEAMLEATLTSRFDKLHCLTEDHHTPFGTLQNFLFCSFKKKTG